LHIVSLLIEEVIAKLAHYPMDKHDYGVLGRELSAAVAFPLGLLNRRGAFAKLKDTVSILSSGKCKSCPVATDMNVLTCRS